MEITLVSAGRPSEEYYLRLDEDRILYFYVFDEDTFLLEVNHSGNTTPIVLDKSELKKLRKMLRRHK